VLNRAGKGQNTALTAAEAVRVVNSYGMVVNTGLIIGFDGETEHTAENMLQMVQGSGAFPTLVLPLHALPNTRLARRMEREGRLFRHGVIAVENAERTDTATTGLNFATQRPRAQVLEDLAHVLEELYRPRNHYQRVALTLSQLKTARKFTPPLRMLPRLAKAFAGIVRTVGMDREAAPLFWRHLLKAAATNPGALEMVLGSAAMNANYHRQSRSYVTALRAQAAEVRRQGEGAYNRSMGASEQCSASAAR
jgi:hypothetical protein